LLSETAGIADTRLLLTYSNTQFPLLVPPLTTTIITVRRKDKYYKQRN
jgi:hypothetical protein